MLTVCLVRPWLLQAAVINDNFINCAEAEAIASIRGGPHWVAGNLIIRVGYWPDLSAPLRLYQLRTLAAARPVVMQAALRAPCRWLDFTSRVESDVSAGFYIKKRGISPLQVQTEVFFYKLRYPSPSLMLIFHLTHYWWSDEITLTSSERPELNVPDSLAALIRFSWHDDHS